MDEQQWPDSNKADSTGSPREDLGEKVMSDIKSDFKVVGSSRVKNWYLWLALAIIIGVSGGIGYVANQSGEFQDSDAAQMELGEEVTSLSYAEFEDLLVAEQSMLVGMVTVAGGNVMEGVFTPTSQNVFNLDMPADLASMRVLTSTYAQSNQVFQVNFMSPGVTYEVGNVASGAVATQEGVFKCFVSDNNPQTELSTSSTEMLTDTGTEKSVEEERAELQEILDRINSLPTQDGQPTCAMTSLIIGNILVHDINLSVPLKACAAKAGINWNKASGVSKKEFRGLLECKAKLVSAATGKTVSFEEFDVEGIFDDNFNDGDREGSSASVGEKSPCKKAAEVLKAGGVAIATFDTGNGGGHTAVVVAVDCSSGTMLIADPNGGFYKLTVDGDGNITGVDGPDPAVKEIYEDGEVEEIYGAA